MIQKEKPIKTSQGDKRGTIDSLIDFLNESKKLGATHYNMRWSGDPMWAFKWFETYKTLTDEEIKKEKIDKLQSEIDQINKS